MRLRSDGTYLSFLDHDDLCRRPIAFRSETHTRLIDLQRQFDPDGVFQPHRVPATTEAKAADRDCRFAGIPFVGWLTARSRGA